LDDQKFNDFSLGCEVSLTFVINDRFMLQGFNSVSFQYDDDSRTWRFVRENFSIPDDKFSNNNEERYFNEYDKFVADLLTKFHNIKRCTNRKLFDFTNFKI
jgi:hypothetical protein